MKKRLNTLINSVGIGILMGLLISLFCNYAVGNHLYQPSGAQFMNHFAQPLNAVLVSVLLWSLMGLVFGGGSLIFDIPHWSLAKQTVVNFFIYYCGFTPLALCAGWFPLSWVHWGIFTLLFILAYGLAWFICTHIQPDH